MATQRRERGRHSKAALLPLREVLAFMDQAHRVRQDEHTDNDWTSIKRTSSQPQLQDMLRAKSLDSSKRDCVGRQSAAASPYHHRLAVVIHCATRVFTWNVVLLRDHVAQVNLRGCYSMWSLARLASSFDSHGLPLRFTVTVSVTCYMFLQRVIALA